MHPGGRARLWRLQVRAGGRLVRGHHADRRGRCLGIPAPSPACRPLAQPPAGAGQPPGVVAQLRGDRSAAVPESVGGDGDRGLAADVRHQPQQHGDDPGMARGHLCGGGCRRRDHAARHAAGPDGPACDDQFPRHAGAGQRQCQLSRLHRHTDHDPAAGKRCGAQRPGPLAVPVRAEPPAPDLPGRRGPFPDAGPRPAG